MDNNNYFNNQNEQNTQSNSSSDYNPQDYSAQNAYSAQNHTAQNGYSDYNSYRNPYQQPGNMNYQTAQTKPKKKSGFGALLGKTVAVALVFGLVAGTVFSGVSYCANQSLGFMDSFLERQEDTGTKDSSSDYNSINRTDSLQQTATGNAGEIQDVSSLVKEVMPSIVAITNIGTVTYHTFWGTQEYESSSCGSGIIVRQDEDYFYIVTNNHVVQNAKTLTVQFSDDSTASCEIKGTDPSDDLAVVRVEKKNVEKDTLKTIKVASIGDSTALQVGEGAIAIGNALGYGQSVSVGYISALGRTVTVQDETTGNTIVNNNMIQTDAAINPGNSGGALLNTKGEVIGINSVKYTDTKVEGFGFAIPMADAMPIVDQLITREKVEESQSAYLGIQGQDISAEMSETYNMPEGIYVYKTIDGSAAEKAGIHQGDIITGFDGQSVRSMNELKELMTYYKAGQKVKITLQRLNNGYEEKVIEVTLGSAKGMLN